MSDPQRPADHDAGVVIEPVPYRAGAEDDARAAQTKSAASRDPRAARHASRDESPPPATASRAPQEAAALRTPQPRRPLRGAFWLAGAVVLLASLTWWLAGREQTRAPASQPAVATPAPVRQPPASPEQAAELQRLNGEVQTLLSELEAHAPLWAAPEWERARADFEAAEAALREVQAPVAHAHLLSAQRALRSLQTRAPQVLKDALAASAQALARADLAGARAPWELAHAIAPGAEEVRALAGRIKNFPELVVLLETAEAFSQAGELAAARENFERALALDPAHPGTREKLNALHARARSQDFAARVRAGHAALTGGDLARARRAFEAALVLRPGASEAARALAQIEREEQARTLDALQAEAAQAAAREDWPRALALYEQAAARDANLQTLRENLRRARARATLDAQLEALASDRARLFAPNSPESARALLTVAEEFSPRGPRLAAQLRRVREHLQVATRALPVELESDGKTEITVQRYKALGAFENKRIALRPGVWTLVGTRTGYRDVRHTLNVQPGARAAARLTVRCTEPI